MEPRAHAGVDAVAGNQDVALGAPALRAGMAVDEAAPEGVPVVVEVGEVHARVHPVRPEPVPHRVEEQELEAPAVDRDLGDPYPASRPRGSTQMRCPRSGHGLMRTPLIVPPIYLKQFDKPVFQVLWHNVMSHMSTAKKVVFLGYSMPEG